jgi:hypothetical protein
MTQIVVDEMMSVSKVLNVIQQWTTACRVTDLRPHERILDDRILTLLRELKQPTFITLDGWFWQRRLCDRHYCIVYFTVPEEQHPHIPHLLRRLFRLPEFRTKANRMGKVIRVSTDRVQYYRLSDRNPHVLSLSTAAPQRRRRRKR